MPKAGLKLIGAKYRFLTVVAPAGRNEQSHRLWELECICGKRVTRTTSNLKCSISCGCIHRKKIEDRERYAEDPPIVIPDQTFGDPSE